MPTYCQSYHAFCVIKYKPFVTLAETDLNLIHGMIKTNAEPKTGHMKVAFIVQKTLTERGVCDGVFQPGLVWCIPTLNLDLPFNSIPF